MVRTFFLALWHFIASLRNQKIPCQRPRKDKKNFKIAFYESFFYTDIEAALVIFSALWNYKFVPCLKEAWQKVKTRLDHLKVIAVFLIMHTQVESLAESRRVLN